MSDSFYPRLSQAGELLPRIRAHLIRAATRHSLPAGFSLDLLPIVEDGLVGYELLPNWATYTYLTIGCREQGEPVLRETLYRAELPRALRVASVNGRMLPQGAPDAADRPRQRDSVLPDWRSAADAAWNGLAALFPAQSRQCIEVNDSAHACLDEALATACARLADCDPRIEFCGVPGEAHYGFALTHANGGCGQLISRTPGTWTLWWKSPANALHEEWAMAPPGIDGVGAWGCAGMSARSVQVAAGRVVPMFPAASARQLRERLVADRRLGDRRIADRPHPDGLQFERRHGDRRQRDRREAPQGGSPA